MRRLAALLVVLTVLPAALVLWFMNATVSSDAVAAQQRIAAANRGQGVLADRFQLAIRKATRQLDV